MSDKKNGKDVPVTEKGTVAVVLKAVKNFDLNGRFTFTGETLTIHETTFMDEIAKGLEKRESRHPATGAMTIASHNPTSPYINHCKLVACSDEARKAYDKLMAKREV